MNDEKFCRDCGHSIRIKAEICPNCGIRQTSLLSSGLVSSGLPSSGERNRLVACVLALLLGGLGFHKFYLGQIFAGVIYLVFCWTFIPAIFSFIEAIMLLVMSDETFNRRFNG